MPYAALVVLGCRVGAEGPSPALARRLARAAREFHAGAAPLVVVSGGRRWTTHPPAQESEARVMARALGAAGVPAAAILEEDGSLTTGENARLTAWLLRRQELAGWPRVLVVTCDWHLPRALGAFRRAGLDAEGAPAPAPPAPWPRRAARGVRERVSAWLDQALVQSAAPEATP